MTVLLYRVEDEICIEMSPEAWKTIHALVDQWLDERKYLGYCGDIEQEIHSLRSAVRAHLQHFEKQPCPNNQDLA